MKQLLILFFLPFFGFSQELTGTIEDKNTGEKIFGVKIVSSEGQRAISDPDGKFILQVQKVPVTLTFSISDYDSLILVVEKLKEIKIKLKSNITEMNTVVVSAGKIKQDVEEVSISMEVLKPALIDNKGISSLDQAVDQSPGVYAMDGQVSIRGGSGFSYGAGSRVLLLWNGIPMISGDAGDAKWNSVPMESASQIEILKGASSVLYGSGALNGIISLTEKEPTIKGETRFKVQSGIYDNPKRSSLKWWDKNPMFGQVEGYHAKMHKKIGYTVSANGFKDQGYREGEVETRGRVSGSFYFRPQKVKRLKAGIGYNVQVQKTGLYIIWESDSLAYTPSGGAVTSVAASTLTVNRGLRINVDPYLKYVDKFENTHDLKTRVYFVQNKNFSNPGQSSDSWLYYGDYQFQRTWKFGGTITSGFSNTYNNVISYLYGNHHSLNSALYGQFDYKYKNLNLTGGVRLEYFQQDNLRRDSETKIGKTTIPVNPIFRAAAHYKVLKYTHLRASFGQGVRYPSVAERFTVTSVGSLNIFPNPNLKRETGWAMELGIKQGVKFGSWKGLIDVAGFINQYDNMMEFAFGAYNPPNIPLNLQDPNSPGWLYKWVGFRAINAEKARISGIEFSFNSEGKIGNVDVRSLIGYTYMNPISLNNDPKYRESFSDTSSNTLKYRFKHLAKADIEVEWKGISIGFSARYNSNMDNIDAVFENEVIPSSGVFILPGLYNYRRENNKGSLVFDARAGYEISKNYRVGFIVNNILNTEYMTRPGDVQAPRSFMLQIQGKF